MARTILEEPTDFSVVLGGPLYQLLRRFHLSDDALGMLRRRMIAASFLTWVPLLILSIWEGLATGNQVNVPFLVDFDVHARFLVALPLLIYAELIVHQRMRLVVRGFLDRKLVPADSINKLDAALQSLSRLRNSVVVEVLLILFVYAVGVLVLRRTVELKTATWQSLQQGSFTITGMWYAFVSLPIFQFILIRWYFRLFLWTRFLYHTSKIRLSLIPTHPDRAGGLGFLSGTVYGFSPLLLAHGTLLSGMIANRIFYMGAKLPDFKMELFALVVVLITIILAPMLVFAKTVEPRQGAPA